VSEADQVARDDETRALAAALREALERRTEKAKQEWHTEFNDAMANGRLVRALRMSARLPDPTMRLEAEVAQKLADLTSEALNADAANERWAMLIEAAGESAVRRLVKPVALPKTANEAVKAAATAQAANVPALVGLLGLTVPPPPRATGKNAKGKSFSSSLKVAKPRNVGSVTAGAAEGSAVAVAEVEQVVTPVAAGTDSDVIANVVEESVSVQELNETVNESQITDLVEANPTDLSDVGTSNDVLAVVQDGDLEVKDN
jgi:hypothetical protein